MNMSKTNSNRFALYVSIGKIVAMAAQFVMPVFLTRYLSKADYGTYAQFYLVQGFVGSVLCFGIQSNPYYFYPNSSSLRQKQIIWNSFIVLLLLGIAGSSLLFVPSINNWLLKNEVLSDNLFIVIGSIIFFMPSNLVDPLSVVRKDKILAMVYHPAGIILKIAAVISFALIFKTIQGILGSLLLLNILLFIIVLGYILKSYPIKHREDFFSFSLLKEQFQYAFPFGIAVILSTTCNQIDKLICVNYLSIEEYAVYSIAFFGIPGVMQIYDALCQVNIMNMATEYKNGTIEQVKNLYQRFVVQTLSFSLPVIGVVCLFSPQIIHFLFSEKYMDAVPFFRLYVLTFILGMVGSGNILRAVGKTKLSMKAFALSSIICIPMTFVLINRYGIWGAISSAMLNTMLPKLFQIFFECKILNSSLINYFPTKEIFKLLGISAFLLLPLTLINIFHELSLINCIILSIIYLLLVYSWEVYINIFIIDRAKVINLLRKVHLFR